MLNGISFLPSRNSNSQNELYKAKFVIQGQKRHKKGCFDIWESAASKKSFTRLLIALPVEFGFSTWIRDVGQANQQSSKKLDRKELLKASDESTFTFIPNIVWTFSYWRFRSQTITTNLAQHLELKRTKGVLSLSTKHVHKTLQAITGLYADYSLSFGNENCLKNLKIP